LGRYSERFLSLYRYGHLGPFWTLSWTNRFACCLAGPRLPGYGDPCHETFVAFAGPRLPGYGDPSPNCKADVRWSSQLQPPCASAICGRRPHLPPRNYITYLAGRNTTEVVVCKRPGYSSTSLPSVQARRTHVAHLNSETSFCCAYLHRVVLGGSSVGDQHSPCTREPTGEMPFRVTTSVRQKKNTQLHGNTRVE
jgi:hypothetical protein